MKLGTLNVVWRLILTSTNTVEFIIVPQLPRYAIGLVIW